MNVFADFRIIDFARSRFFSPWVVTGSKVTDFVPAPLDIGNQVAFGDLLVINVEKNLAGWAIHGPANCEGLVGLL